MYVRLSKEMLRRTRHCLKTALPGARSSQVAEALAASLRFRTSIALQAWIDCPERDPLLPRWIDPGLFVDRMGELGFVGLELFGETRSRSPDAVRIAPGCVDTAVDAIAARVAARPGLDRDSDRWAHRVGELLRVAIPAMAHRHGIEGASFDETDLPWFLPLERIRWIEGAGAGMAAEIRRRAADYLLTLPARPAAMREQHGYAEVLIRSLLPSPCEGGDATFRIRGGAYPDAWMHLTMVASENLRWGIPDLPVEVQKLSVQQGMAFNSWRATKGPVKKAEEECVTCPAAYASMPGSIGRADETP